MSRAAPRFESASLASVETCFVDAPMNCSTSVVGLGAVVVLATVVVGAIDVGEGVVVAAVLVGVLVDV